MNRFSKKTTIRLAVLAAIALASPVLATDYTWQSTAAGTYNWGDAGNWVSAPGNTTSDVDWLNGDSYPASGLQTINLNAVVTLGTLNLGCSTGSFSLQAGTGGSLSLGGASTINQTSVSLGDTIAAPINVTTTYMTIANSSANPLTISGNITATGALGVTIGNYWPSNTAGGLVILSGTNTYAGGTTIWSKSVDTGVGLNTTLRLTNASAAGTGAISMGPKAGTALQLFSTGSTNFGNAIGSYTNGSFSIVTADASGSLTNTGFTHTLGNLGLGRNVLTITGGYGLTFGNVTVNEPQYTNGGYITNNALGMVTIGSVTPQSGVSTTNSFTIDGTGSTTVNGAIYGTGAGTYGFIKYGTGTATLNGNNTYPGGTTVGGGTLIIAGNNSGYTGGTLLNSATAVLRLTNGNALGASTINSWVSGGTLQLYSTGSTNFGNNFASSTNANFSIVTADASGSLTNTGFTHTLGTLGIWRNTVTVTGGYGLTFGNVTVGEPQYGGGTLVNNALGLLTVGSITPAIVSSTLSFTIGGTGNTLVTGALNGTGSGSYGFTKSGTGTVTLNGNNTYTGGTAVNGGLLIIGGNNSTYAGNIGIGAATACLTNGNAGGTNAINMYTNGGTLQLHSTGSTYFGNGINISGNPDIATVDVSDATGSTATGYTHTLGAVSMYFGTLNVTGSYGLTIGAVTASNGAPSVITQNAAGLLTVASIAVGNQFTIGGTGNTLVTGVVSNIAGAAAFYKNDAGTVTLAGTNTYSGTTTVNTGTLVVANTSGLGTSTATNAVNPANGTILSLINDGTGTVVFGPGSGYNLKANTSGNATTIFTINVDRSATGSNTGTVLQLGTLTQDTPNGYTRQLNVTGGHGYTLALAGFSLAANSTYLINPTTGNVTLNAVAIANNSTLTLDGTGSGAITGAITLTGTGSITKQNTSTWSITSLPATASNFNVNAGKLILNGNSTGFTGTIALNGPSATVSVTNALGLGSGSIQTYGGAGNVVQFLSDAATTFSGSVVSASQLVDYSIVAADAANNGATGVTHTMGNLTLNRNTATISGGYGLTIGNVTLNGTTWSGSGITNNSAGLVSMGNVTPDTSTANRFFTVAGSGNIAVTGNVSGTGLGVNQNGSAILTLSNANSYGGGTNVNSGTLRLANAQAAGTGTIFLGNGSTLQLHLTSPTNFGNAVSISGNPDVGTIDTADATGSAATGFTHTLGALNMYFGTLSVTGGYGLTMGNVTLGGGGNSNINQNASGTLTVGGIDCSHSGSITFLGTGNTIVGGSFISASDNVGYNTYDVMMNGTGTVTLNGTANAWYANTVVSSGTLIINGNLPATSTRTTTIYGGKLVLSGNSTGYTTYINDYGSNATLCLTSANAAGTSTIRVGTVTGNVVQLFNNTSTSFGNNVETYGNTSFSMVSANAAGSLTATGGTHTMGTLLIHRNTLTLSGGYGLTFGNVTINEPQYGPAHGGGGDSITNNALGLVTLGSITADPAVSTTKVLYFEGSGNTTVNGTISGTGTFGITKYDAGTLTLSSANTYAGNTTVYGGTLVLNALNARPAGGVLYLGKDSNGGAKAVFNSITGETVDTIRTQLLGGATFFKAGLVANEGIGYLTTDQYNALDGASLASGGVVAKYTYLGDVNLDGKITAADFAQIDASYLKGTYSSSGAKWFNGDFNYDGAITSADFAIIDAAYTAQGGPLAADIVAGDMVRFAGTDFAMQYQAALSAAGTVPEPASLGLLGLGVLGLLGRRRR